MLIPLSFPLTRTSPLYPGTPAPVIEPLPSRSPGISSRASILSVHSHSGTHIDLPPHFCGNDAGRFPLTPPALTFSPARCVRVAADPSSAISPGHLKPHLPEIQNTEALLIRTGTGFLRSTDPGRYASSHPRVDPSVPSWLRAECPGLKLFGIDIISITDPSHREEGRACHRRFLCDYPPILLLEDADLTDDRLLNHSFTLELHPFMAEWIDGLPVVALAEIP
jgi:arylformamidase